MSRPIFLPSHVTQAFFAELDDDQLVEHSRLGERTAFDELVRRHRGRLIATCRAVVGNAAEAEEAAQDALLKAYQRLNSYEGRAQFGTWLVQVARNEARQRLRKKRPSAVGDDVLEAASTRTELSAEAPPRPDRAAVQRQVGLAALRALGRLPAEARDALLAGALDGQPLHDIADELGVSVAAVKSRMHRARNLLREDLASELGPRSVAALI